MTIHDFIDYLALIAKLHFLPEDRKAVPRQTTEEQIAEAERITESFNEN